MELERKRGISVSSTVLQFEYDAFYVNLLDTPGHKDFSEDTYRVLTAVDAAVMVIDAGKGIEPQTRKLFNLATDPQESTDLSAQPAACDKRGSIVIR